MCEELFSKSVFNGEYQDLICYYGSMIEEYLQNILQNQEYNQIF